MGGAEDLPKRASSPLKRPAADLEPEDSSNLVEDVDMIQVAPSDPAESPSKPASKLSRTDRGQSVNMLEDEGKPTTSGEGEAEVPKVVNVTRSKSPASEIPSIDVQISTVKTMIGAYLEQTKEGDKVYLVSKRWLGKVLCRGTEARQNSKEEPEGEIGPIDNSDIIQQTIKDYAGVDFVQLKHGLGSEDFELFPEDAWNMVEEWYGVMPGTIPIERFAHNTNPDRTGIKNIQFEFHPPILTIHRLYSDHSGINIPQLMKVTNPPAPVIIMSRSSKYYDFLRLAKKCTGIEASKKTRVWRLPRKQPAAELKAPARGAETPPTSRPNSPSGAESVHQGPLDSWTHALLDVVTFIKLEKGVDRELIEGPDISTNDNYNGHSNLAQFGLGDDESIVLDEQVNTKDFVSTFIAPKATSTALVRTGLTTSQPNSGRTSPAPSGPMTRGRAQKNGRMPGTVGLSNLGNTCYMNSALQCVRSVEELTKYFLSGASKPEVNYENPLGNRGEVANAYRKLLEEIYKDPSPPSVGPRAFKNTIGKFAPSFSGYGQQDSQEFVGFLLDGLQEDLSRVKKKPYIEKPDSTDDMVNNPEAIAAMAAKVWDITKKRDDSVIADLFTGMYKSTLVCPDCAKVSITFDPFNNLTLQLPIESIWSHTIVYYPMNDYPIFMTVDMSKQGTILQLKEFVSSRVGVPVERLFAAEQFKEKFYKIYTDDAIASDDIGNNDRCGVYELEAKPTNWPPRKQAKKKSNSYSYNEPADDLPHWDDPMCDKMIVPVFYRKRVAEGKQNKFKSRSWTVVPTPHFIIVTKEEARSEERIKRKILEKVATFSTHPDFHSDDESPSSSSDNIDPELVITTGSDADSSGDGKVAANSVDGEDEIVNVTKQAEGTQDSSKTSTEVSKSAQATHQPSLFDTRRPKFLDPNEYLDPQFQNLFSLHYMPAGKDTIPSGWSSVDDDKLYPLLSSRAPQVPLVEEGSSNGDGSNGRTGSESSEGDDGYLPLVTVSATTRMEDESDEDDDLPRHKVALPVRPAPRRKQKQKTYSKKGQRNRKFQSTEEPEEMEDEGVPLDDGPLVRAGEPIVVDWNDKAYEALFEGDNNDDFCGQGSWLSMSTFDDPELIAKRQLRSQRRKNGIDLNDCLDEFGKEEILSEMDMWYCPRCKEHRRASKKFELWKTPDILVMHLKRFSSSALRRDKLDVMVDFPLEGLDLTSRVVEKEDGKQEIYDLFAVDDHWGGLGGGHYTAFAKNFVDHEWYEYNDSSVSKVKDPKRVVSQSAYLLFYRRRSDEPLGGPRFKQIIQEYDNPPAERSEEDEASDQGEDQGLAGNSSTRGSSSPFKGAGATLHQPNRGLGLKSKLSTVDPQDLEQLPDYDESNAMAGSSTTNDGLRASIEDDVDEGIGLDSAMENENDPPYVIPHYQSDYNPVRAAWGWNAINDDASTSGGLDGLESLNRNNRSNMLSGIGSDIELQSDIVDDNSSADSLTRRSRLEDFDNADPLDFEDPSPVPDMDDMDIASGVALQHDLYESINGYHAIGAQANDDMEVEEPAAEIHIDEDDDLKLG